MNNTNTLKYNYQRASTTFSYTYIIEERVHWLLEQYHPREWNSNLKVSNPDNKEDLNRWKKWVIWIIKSEILWSWFWNFTDLELFNIITNSLHEYFQNDPWYHQFLLKILPTLSIEN